MQKRNKYIKFLPLKGTLLATPGMMSRIPTGGEHP